MKTFTNSEGTEFKIGDFVKCYYKEYFKIVEFFFSDDIYKQEFGKSILQVKVQQLFDDQGNPTIKYMKTCKAELLEHVTQYSITQETSKAIADAVAYQDKLKKMIDDQNPTKT